MKPDISDMTIIIDTREQTPFSFSYPISRKTLIAGDYSILGFEDKIAIERKALGDLTSCVGKDRNRFIKQMEVLSFFHRKYLVIEANLNYILQGDFGYTKINPESVLGTICKIAIEYNIFPIFAGGHRSGAKITERLLIQYYKKYRGGKI